MDGSSTQKRQPPPPEFKLRSVNLQVFSTTPQRVVENSRDFLMHNSCENPRFTIVFNTVVN